MKFSIKNIEINLNDEAYNAFANRLYPITEKECIYYAETELNNNIQNLINDNRITEIENAINKAMFEEASV